MAAAFGEVVVVKRNGQDGPSFPLEELQTFFGRDEDNDIRIMLPKVSRRHCVLSVDDDGKVNFILIILNNPLAQLYICTHYFFSF